MPEYSYLNLVNNQIVTKFFKMSEMDASKEIIEENGVKYKRVYVNPNMGIDTILDPFSPQDFIRKTNKPGTLGGMSDLSAEMSKRRADKNGGYDEVREKFFMIIKQRMAKNIILENKKRLVKS
jgi:hypothetical protein